MFVSEIWVYPIKSLGGVRLQNSTALFRGLEWDRRYVLVDSNDTFISQRTVSKMATLGVVIEENNLRVFNKANPEQYIDISESQITKNTLSIKIWEHEVQSFCFEKTINDWFSKYLDINVRLVSMNDNARRKRSLDIKPYQTEMSFADGYPYLFLSKASVEDLNSHLSIPVDIRQFRANIILADAEAFQEDSLKRFSIADTTFNMIKPCKRCKVITLNQDTGIASKEPMTYLSKTRRDGNHVIFAMNAAILEEGSINIGDKIVIQ